jgi:hypothetical protein
MIKHTIHLTKIHDIMGISTIMIDSKTIIENLKRLSDLPMLQHKMLVVSKKH